MSHNTPFSFLIFLFHLFPVLISAESRCPKWFDCPGLLAPLEFPLSNNSRPDCGLFTVNCTNSSNIEIQLQSGGTWYQILRRISPNKFFIRDPWLEYLLHRNSCFSLFNLSVPTTPFTSFAISPNITLFKCFNVTNRHETNENFESQNCSEVMVYYRNPANNSTVNHSIAPHPCVTSQLPIINPAGHYPSNLFQLLSSNFTVEWNISDECMSCHKSGGQCTTNSVNEFLCRTVRSWTTLIIVSALSGASVILICLLVIVIWLRKKRIEKFYRLKRNISSEPSPSKPADIINDGSFQYGIPIFSYTELEEATNNFDPTKELGDGGFGTVYHGILRDGREVAIKRLYEHNYKRVEQFLNEIKILTCLRHQNLVTLYGCTSRQSRELLLVYEYIQNGTVADHLHKKRAKETLLTWSVRMNIAIEAARALAYLHKSDIVHRDVKTNNILLDSNFAVKVADFGLSRLFPTDVTHISTAPQGTPGYVDPEYHRCYQLTDKSDVYSFGVVLIELISSMPAVDITRHRDEINLANFALNRIQRCAFDDLIDSSLGNKTNAEITRMTTSVAELAFQCLQVEKDMRPSMDEVLVVLMEIKKGYAGKIPISPETDEVELLKMKNFQSSPSAVTHDVWMSGSTSSIY